MTSTPDLQISCDPAVTTPKHGRFPCHAGSLKTRGTRIAGQVLLIAACAGVVSACGTDAPEEVQTQAVVPVTTEAAATGTVRATIHASGTVEPAPGADHLVTAPENARIVELPKAEGDRVRRGDLLVRFEIPTLGADSEARRAEVARAQARLTNGMAAKIRAHDLFDRGVAARKEVEDADRELADGEAALRQAEAARRASATLAERTEVRARFDGIVARRSHNPGDVVDASASDPILRVIDPNRLEVIASVPLGEVSHIRPGAGARLFLSADDAQILKVVSRPTVVDAQTGAAPVRLSFVGEASLPAGTPVQVEIDGQQRENVVVVPLSAIVREGDDTAVFVVAGDKAQRKAVTLGLSDAGHVEVRSGIKPGDLVIVSGQNGLPDGATVTTTPRAK